ncbi:hypothetical protein GW17_00001661 [Ensete ventricosum]|nr:hypothetical protein GW17_00001661 [Ensete ventricosum]
MFSKLFGKPKEQTNAVATLDKLNEVLMDFPSPPFCRLIYLIMCYWVQRAQLTSGISWITKLLSCLCLATLEMLEKKEKVLLKKAAAEVEKAKEFTRAKNKRDAIEVTSGSSKDILEHSKTGDGYRYKDELEAELEELEGAELEEQLLQPATTAPAAPVHVPAGRVPARPVPQKNTAEEDELAALQAEMAM